MFLSASRPLRTLLFGAVIALMVGLLGPVSPATAAGPITGLNPVIAASPQPIVGNTLTASQVGATSPQNSSFTWQWQADNVNIVGATNSSYLLTSAELGKKMRVVMTAHANGKDDTPASSAETTVVRGVFTSAPTVGIDDTTPVVDDEITATVTTPSVPAADSYTIEWFADGNQVGIGANYTPTAADVTKTLTARATAVKANYVGTSGTSDPTAAVAKADFNPGPTASITGTAKVGEELTAVASGEAPAGSYTYQWNANAVAISGATSDKYTLTGAEDGALITVTVTATKAGYNDSPDTSDPTSAVAKGDFTGAPTTVGITGTPKVGVQLTASASGETPAGDGYTYQWKADDVDIAGATSSTFTPTAAEEAKLIKVTVTATKVGYNPSGTATSDATAAVAKGDFSGAPTASISGTPRVGFQLTANASGETPTGTGYTYQWQADNVDIGSATSSTFTPTASEVGKLITVVVRATKPGYNDSDSDESDPTEPVAPAVLQSFTTPATANLSTTAPQVGQPISVNPTGEVPDAVRVRLPVVPDQRSGCEVDVGR